MTGLRLVAQNELRRFSKHDKSVFIIYGLLVFGWGALLSANMSALAGEAGMLWLVFFSVIVSGNFSGTVFISERVSGSLEVMLTCGISRRSILWGKVVFVIAMAFGMGMLCYLFALVIHLSKGESMLEATGGVTFVRAVVLYISACLMNATCGAWLSVRVSNPRLLHFVNLLVLSAVVAVDALASAFLPLSSWNLAWVLLGVGGLFGLLAERAFASEKVVQPLVY